MKRVGIYAGTFDPIHEGHVAFAEQAHKQVGLDKVFFLVEPRPRRKQGVHALEHREAMVRLAIADKKQFGSIQLEQQNFTPADTLPKLLSLFEGAEICLLMGDDVFAYLNDWPNVDKLLSACTFIIGTRNNEPKRTDQHIHAIESLRGIRLRTHYITTESQGVSSSKIRQTLRQKRDIAYLLPEIRRYVLENNLYITQE